MVLYQASDTNSKNLFDIFFSGTNLVFIYFPEKPESITKYGHGVENSRKFLFFANSSQDVLQNKWKLLFLTYITDYCLVLHFAHNSIVSVSISFL